MPELGATRLVLFMTRGVSLAQWDSQGVFDRELALYRELRPRLAGLSIVTYGGDEEQAYAARLPGIEILANRWRLPAALYARLAPRLHTRSLLSAGLLKTNQMKGAEAALAARRASDARLIVRCGYLWSLAAAQFKHGLRGQWNYAQAVRTETEALARADMISVTTEAMRQHVAGVYQAPAGRIRVIPNYVLDEFFEAQRPAAARRIVFVGRLEPDKNPMRVVESAQGLGVPVTLVGQGSLRPQLERRAVDVGVALEIIPRLPHRDLPGLLGAASVFILPSPREGHPKTLIEAMAAGLAVIGTDAPGIRELICHQETGLLAADDPAAFREAAARLLSDEGLRASLGRQAREYAREHFAFDKVLRAELRLLAETAQGPTG